MTPQEIEQLASEAWERTGSLSLYVGINDRDDAFHRHFAAMVLERAAQNHDEAAAGWGQIAKNRTDWMYDCKQMAAEQLANDLRNMAKGLG